MTVLPGELVPVFFLETPTKTWFCKNGVCLTIQSAASCTFARLSCDCGRVFRSLTLFLSGVFRVLTGRRKSRPLHGGAGVLCDGSTLLSLSLKRLSRCCRTTVFIYAPGLLRTWKEGGRVSGEGA